MAYSKTTWTSGTAFNTTNMNNIENGIQEAHNKVNQVLNMPKYEIDAKANDEIDSNSFTGQTGSWSAYKTISFASNRFTDTPSFTATPLAQDSSLVSISYTDLDKNSVKVRINRKTTQPSTTYFSWSAIHVV